MRSSLHLDRVLTAIGQAHALLSAARAGAGDTPYEWRLALVRKGAIHKERGAGRGKLAAVLAVASALRRFRLQGYQAQAAVLVPLTEDGTRDQELPTERIDLGLLALSQREIQLKLATGHGLTKLAASG